MDVENFKLLTLNCWGVFTPVGCEKRHERLSVIGDKLSEGYYDIILLQEIWTDDDFIKLKTKLLSKFPYSNYFHSNLIGSGCCIFSKFKILNTFFYRYQSNGYPHCFYHGDWFGGKGMGLATLEVGARKYIVNVYVTHMHARYRNIESEDTYSFHRLMQGYEASEFIRLTSSSCDAVIVGGDFNMDDTKLGLNWVSANSGLKDAWLLNSNAPSKYSIQDAATCDRPDSPYANKKWLKFYPDGERIDYIFYRQNACIKLICTDCILEMRAVPDHDMHYSDHSGIEARFEISQNPMATADQVDIEQRATVCQQSLLKADIELKRIKMNCVKDLVCFVVTLLCVITDYPNSLLMLLTGVSLLSCLHRICTVILSIACFIFFWYGVVIRTCEKKAVLNAKQGMEFIALNSRHGVEIGREKYGDCQGKEKAV